MFLIFFVAKHRVPISEMGNYHEVLMKREELRDVDEENKRRPPLFGNPFRTEKVTENSLKFLIIFP